MEKRAVTVCQDSKATVAPLDQRESKVLEDEEEDEDVSERLDHQVL